MAGERWLRRSAPVRSRSSHPTGVALAATRVTPRSGWGRRCSGPTAAAAARTSQALSDSPSRRAASSTRALRASGMRRFNRDVPPSSSSADAARAGWPAVEGMVPSVHGPGRGGSPARRVRWRRDHEARVTPPQPELHRARRQLAGDLVSGGRQHLQEDEPGSRLERSGEPLRQGAGLVATRLGGYRQLVAQDVRIEREVHVSQYGTQLAPRQCQNGSGQARAMKYLAWGWWQRIAEVVCSGWYW